MTLPSGGYPPGSITNPSGTGLSAHSQKTQAQWKAEQTGGVKNSFEGNFWANMIGNMFGGFLNGIAGFIASLVQGAFGFVGGFLDLVGGLLGVKNDSGQAKAEATAAIGKAESAASAVAAQGTQVQAVKAAVLQFQEGLPLQPFNHSMTNSEMTFDRVLLEASSAPVEVSTTNHYNQVTRKNIFSSTGFLTGEGFAPNDTNASSDITTRFFPGGPPVFTPAANSVVGGFIRATWGGQRESFTYAVGAVTGPCSLRLLIGVMNADTGNITIVWVSPDKTPEIGTGAAEYIEPIPDGVVLADRETVFVAVHQYGSGNVRPLYGKSTTGPPRDGLLYPAKQNARFGRSSILSAGNVVSAGSLLFDNDQLPWLGIGLSLIIPVPAPTSYYEDFADNKMPPTLVRRSSVSSTITDGNFVMAGSSDGETNYQVTKRLNRDDHYVESVISGNPSQHSQYLGLRSDSSGNNRIVCAVRNAGVFIARRGSATNTLASASVSMAAGVVIRFMAIGNVYSVYQVSGDDLQLLCQYVDSANVLPRGIDNRYTTIGTSRTLFANSSGWGYLLAADVLDQEAA